MTIYKVKWKGYPIGKLIYTLFIYFSLIILKIGECTWELIDNIKNLYFVYFNVVDNVFE